MLYPIEPRGQVRAILLELMKRFQVFTALLLLAIPASGYAVNDIEDYKYSSAIRLLESNGIVEGYEDGSFRPNKTINRAEFLKLVMLSVYGNQAFSTTNTRCFTDFVGQEQWYWTYACTAKDLGIINGNPDGTFRGDNVVNLAEALKMSFEAWKVPLEVQKPDRPWYERYMNKAAEREVFRRFPYTPEYLLTRGEMAQLLVQLDEPIAVLTGTQADPNNTVSVEFPPKPSVCGNGIVEGTEQCDDGNTQDSDGCSSICILVAEPIYHGALRVEQVPVIESSRASGTKDIPLFAFTSIAGRQDVYITTLKFKSAVGSLSYAENYRLIIDNNGDGTVETLYGRATPNGEEITFGNLNILIKDGVYKRVELWADITPTFSMSSIALEFDTSQTDFVEGVDSIDGKEVSGIILDDGTCQQQSICWIAVYTQTTQTVNIQSQGNLDITKDSVPIGQSQIVASGKISPALRLIFRADSEDIIVKDFAIDGVSSSIDHLNFYTDGASKPFAAARKGSCATIKTGRFCMDTDFIIPQGGEKNILIAAVVRPDTQGAVSGEEFTLSVSALTDTTAAVVAEGYYSGQRLAQNDGDSTLEGEIFIGTSVAAANSAITADTHQIVLAKIDDITNSNSDADNSPITTGTTTFAQFTFRAAVHENTSGGSNSVEIQQLKFTVSAVNTQFDSGAFYLFNTENSGVTSLCSADGQTGTITVTCSGLDSSSVSTYISQGDSISLALRGTISNPQVSAGVSIVQASLGSLSDPNITGTVLWSDGVQDFEWVDIGTTSVKSTNYRLN